MNENYVTTKILPEKASVCSTEIAQGDVNKLKRKLFQNEKKITKPAVTQRR